LLLLLLLTSPPPAIGAAAPLLLPTCVSRLTLPSVLCVSKVLLLLPPPFFSFAIATHDRVFSYYGNYEI